MYQITRLSGFLPFSHNASFINDFTLSDIQCVAVKFKRNSEQ